MQPKYGREAYGVLRRGGEGVRGLPALQLAPAQADRPRGLQARSRRERKADARPRRVGLHSGGAVPGEGLGLADAAASKESLRAGKRASWRSALREGAGMRA